MSDIFPVITAADDSGDILVGCIGYEIRSSHLLRTTTKRASNLFFDYQAVDELGNGVCSYTANYDTVQEMGATSEPDFEKFLCLLEAQIEGLDKPSIDLDITSFDRGKIGQLIIKIFSLREQISTVTFVYAPRVFKPFDLYKFDVVQSFGPALPAFFGTAVGYEKPLTLVLGAGYEYGKAVGAIDTLEPDHIYCFRPTGTNPEFDEHIDLANVDFSFIDNPENIFEYDLNDAIQLYHDLRGLVSYEMVDQNVLLLPLGPKLFAALSMLIATIYHPDIMVWRHSTALAKLQDTIEDADTTGKLVKFPFRFIEAG